MRVTLKRISQDVDLVNPGTTANFLVLRAEADESAEAREPVEFRVPISEETVHVLIREIARVKPMFAEGEHHASEERDAEDVPEEFDGATEFGGDEDQEEVTPPKNYRLDGDEEDPEHEEEHDGPSGEEQVRSV
jgi:hypothetical protein